MAAVAEVVDVVEVPQHLRALKAANEVRLARAALKRAIKRGDTSVVAVLQDTPPEAESMAVMELLMTPTRWGRERSRRALAKAGTVTGGEGMFCEPIPEQKPVGALTERQRTALAQLV